MLLPPPRARRLRPLVALPLPVASYPSALRAASTCRLGSGRSPRRLLTPVPAPELRPPGAPAAPLLGATAGRPARPPARCHGRPPRPQRCLLALPRSGPAAPRAAPLDRRLPAEATAGCTPPQHVLAPDAGRPCSVAAPVSHYQLLAIADFSLFYSVFCTFHSLSLQTVELFL
ncbi:hypothetical protein BS78_K041400 [Paspalum vaginatum]|uniref:Uncharacterized protein n=1 Tax=Paspalum vaginatum TaxID=158149 RepID=A0A9W8CH06_9POAL|nr:hypothetical protein BS78_K041400 [Paspalum vaginatum]